MTPPVDLTALRTAFTDLADTMEGRAPRWSQVSRAIATSEEAEPLLTALSSAPTSQRRPVLALAAVHDLALSHTDSPLAALLARTDEVPFADLWSAVLALVHEHGARFRELLTTRHTQTNEVGRCAVLVPALAALCDEVGPLGLVEFGASAGLLLNLDRYGYRYSLGDRVVELRPEVDADPSVTLTCGVRGTVDVPEDLPDIDSRLGVDPLPVDLHDPEATRWLQACVWPDQQDRLAVLRLALDIARTRPVTVVRDDGVERVPHELRHVAAHPVMMSSWALTYVPAPRRRALWERLTELGRRRDLSAVLFEDPALIPEIPLPHRPDDRGRTVIALVRWRSGRVRVQRLGTAHPHGYWWHAEP